MSLERDSGRLDNNYNNKCSRLGLRVGALHGELERLAGEPGAGLWPAGVGAAPPLTRSRHVPARHEHSSHDPDRAFVVNEKIRIKPCLCF